MKKSLIALLVATLPAAAFADVTIYGTLKAGVEYNDNGTTKKTNIDDLGSRIGFKGAEDLGSGLKAIWQVETGFAVDGNKDQYSPSNSGTFANRNSFLGLQSNLGTLRFGNVSNFLDSDMGTVDVWQYNSDALGLSVFTRDGTRLKNSVRYDLPSVVPGLTAALQYGTKEVKGLANNDRETTVLGLGYENSGFFGKYAYIHESKNVAKLNDYKLNDSANDKHRLEVGYNANNLFVGLAYQQQKGNEDIVGWESYLTSVAIPVGIAATDKVKTQEIALTAAYTFGAITPKFSYVKAKDVKVGGQSIGDSGYDQYVVGADYALSKRTTIGAQYGDLDFKGNNKDLKSFGLNMVHSF
ncbi:hypothetical protein BI347_06590 [Chromobacterium sphagni]|uniref:Porin domain-containing protein n=1 Tax=Chromobacterium sphagni TaxID=1903179 RepID=A0A1S1X0Z4_9NEIS|nr:porin [Chromobacterium sphagni]OHX13207.1 hypothetical protein BI347_06590 [Chromobacterium sphagni]